MAILVFIKENALRKAQHKIRTALKSVISTFIDVFSRHNWDLGMWGAGKSPVVAVVTGSVLQAEAGFVALGHRVVRGGVQQFVVAELVHAVEVPVDQQQPCSTTHACFISTEG